MLHFFLNIRLLTSTRFSWRKYFSIISSFIWKHSPLPTFRPFRTAQHHLLVVKNSQGLCTTTSCQPACLNSVRMRAVMHHAKTMTRPLPFNYSAEGCLEKITKPAVVVSLPCFSVYILTQNWVDFIIIIIISRITLCITLLKWYTF